jgi:hypothetical protein
MKTNNKKDYTNHLLTAKHYQLTNVNKFPAYVCKNCKKIYRSRVGLWKHNKTCDKICDDESDYKSDDVSLKNLVLTLALQNKEILSCCTELQKENMELKKHTTNVTNKVLELCKNGITNNSHNNNTNNSHNNSNNKSFNLQFFLNETCKNAMNISDFVNSVKLQLSDLEEVGEKGYVKGISNIIIKNLRSLDVTERPIHCTDKKRETLYVKHENKWEKENSENKKVRLAIKQIAHKNTFLINSFKDKYPNCIKSESIYSDKYNKILVESMGGHGNNDNEKEEKIIKKISKEIIVDK